MFVLGLLLYSPTLAQNSTKHSLIGSIVNTKNQPVPYATIWINDINRGIGADGKGEFTLKEIPMGTHFVQVRCLGYSELNTKVVLTKKATYQIFVLQPKSFALDSVVVTAKQDRIHSSTSYSIDNDAIEHEQIANLTDVMTLLPGGQTFSKDLVYGSRRRIALRSEQYESDRPSFGTAIEVDGIRLSNNATFSTIKGVDARIISTDNIERITVITGIPSVEHGDLTSGLVKVQTKLGVTPFNIKLSATPRQKHASISKGLPIGKNAGVLNLSYDFTKSNSNIASPYTTYLRNAFTLRHRKTFLNNTNSPLVLSSTIAGNVGGYNSQSDPDEYKDSYTKSNAMNIRGGFNVNWQVKSKILSNIKLSAHFNYTNNKYEHYYYQSEASSSLAFHGIEEGYFVGQKYDANKPLAPIQIRERGSWNQTAYDDSEPLNYGAKLRLQKAFFLQKWSNNLKIGVDFSGSGNVGKGEYYANRAYTPTWREHNYSQEPYLNNLAIYIEDKLSYKVNDNQSIIFSAGLRNDYSIVKDARYKNVNALSPRFNLRYNIIKQNSGNKFIKSLSCYTGWGQAVKLPSFGMLYTRPTYHSRLAFVPGTLADGTTYYAYYLEPNIILANKNLRWQKNRQFELGLQGRIKKVSFSLVYFNTIGLDQYSMQRHYIPFTYYLTTPHQLADVQIPYENRSYTINSSGTVTVHDKKGILPDEILTKKEKCSFKSASYTDNGSPVNRQGIEWVVDFGKIKAIRTSLRLDGKYYFYKHLNNKIIARYQGDNQLMSSGQHYQYIGYYYGGSNMANGRLSKRLTANATFITHIPKLRLIFSLKIEGTFINSNQNLSEMPNGKRAFTIAKQGDTLPKDNNESIYDGNSFAALFPLYYTSFDDMKTKIPFEEKYIWAYNNDKVLFNDLTKMVQATNRTYYFKESNISSYFSTNINVSKEIGKQFKLTFYANNFLNTIAKVHFEQEQINRTLLNSGLIAPFSYGLSLQIKL